MRDFYIFDQTRREITSNNLPSFSNQTQTILPNNQKNSQLVTIPQSTTYKFPGNFTSRFSNPPSISKLSNELPKDLMNKNTKCKGKGKSKKPAIKIIDL